MKKDLKQVSPRGQVTISKILDSTLELVQREGLVRLTTNHISEESGVKVGSIYHFFPNKEAILVELVTRWQQQIQLGVRYYLDSIEENTALDDLVIGIVALNLDEEYEYVRAFEEIVANSALVAELSVRYQAHLEAVANLIAEHYMRSPSRPAGIRRAQAIEFCLFLHPMVTEGMSVTTDKKGKARERHLHWFNAMIRSTVKAFEDSI